MIDETAFNEIVALYEKHGWVLRRVLHSEDPGTRLSEEISARFADVPVKRSKIDAAWFSRPPAGGGVAWELRHLGPLPYALVENVDENSPDLEVLLAEVEARLLATIAARRTA